MIVDYLGGPEDGGRDHVAPEELGDVISIVEVQLQPGADGSLGRVQRVVAEYSVERLGDRARAIYQPPPS